jgi:hypothetical protein
MLEFRGFTNETGPRQSHREAVFFLRPPWAAVLYARGTGMRRMGSGRRGPLADRNERRDITVGQEAMGYARLFPKPPTAEEAEPRRPALRASLGACIVRRRRG